MSVWPGTAQAVLQQLTFRRELGYPQERKSFLKVTATGCLEFPSRVPVRRHVNRKFQPARLPHKPPGFGLRRTFRGSSVTKNSGTNRLPMPRASANASGREDLGLVPKLLGIDRLRRLRPRAERARKSSSVILRNPIGQTRVSSTLDVAKPSPVVSLKALVLKVQIPSGIEGDGFTGIWKVNLLRKVGTH